MGCEEMKPKEYKIQTGLRVPEELHTDLQERAKEIGVSVNQLILMLIYIGIKLIEKGVIPQDYKE